MVLGPRVATRQLSWNLIERVPPLGMPQLRAGRGSHTLRLDVMDVALDEAIRLQADLLLIGRD